MRRTVANTFLSLALLAGGSLAGAAPAAAETACADWDLQPTGENVTRVAASIVCLLNEQRAASALAPLRQDSRLDSSSLFHARDMVRHHYLAHRREGGPILIDRIRPTGYFDRVAGGLYTENVGVAPDANSTPWAIVDAWMRSDDHRVNIMRPEFRDIGVGIVFAAPDPAFYAEWNSVVYATDFGRRYYSRPAPVCFETRSTDRSAPRALCTKRPHRKKRKRRVRR